MNTEGESTTTMVLNQHQSLTTIYEELSLHPQVSAVSLLIKETSLCTTENHNQNAAVETSANGCIYKTTPEHKTQGTLQKRRQKGFKSQMSRDFAVRLGLLVTSESTPVKSHQHDNLNVN